MNLDYYKILGVTKKSSSEEIKKAYKKLAIKYHPDKNDGEELSTEIFKSVKEAYETLSDNHKKTIYDNKQSYSRPITKSQQSYQSSTNRKNNTYQPKPKYESDLKYKLYALAVLAIFTLLIMAIYPFINKWASNDKGNVPKADFLTSWLRPQSALSDLGNVRSEKYIGLLGAWLWRNAIGPKVTFWVKSAN